MGDLSRNVPGQAVISELLRLQDESPLPSAAGRIFGVRPIPRQAGPFMAGVEGERVVGSLLARLDPTWTVLHAVPVGVGGGEIDHVVVSRAGVFTVSSKAHHGEEVWVVHRQLRVAGRTTDHLREARHDATRAARLLADAVGTAVEVTPVLAIVGARRLTLREQPQDVVVLDAYRLARWLRSRPAVLSSEEAERVAQAARATRTWTAAAVPVDAGDLVPRYEALLARCRTARAVRLGWTGGAAAGLALLVGRVVLG